MIVARDNEYSDVERSRRPSTRNRVRSGRVIGVHGTHVARCIGCEIESHKAGHSFDIGAIPPWDDNKNR